MASLLILAIWVGGLAVLGFVAAPTIFSTIEAQDPAAGRALAGLVFGAVFARFQYAAIGLGLLLAAVLVLRARFGPPPARLAWRLWIVATMIGIGAATAFIIGPRIDHIRQEVTGTVAALPDTDPRKSEFGRLHGLSNIFMLLTLVAGVGLLGLEATDARGVQCPSP